MKKSAIAAAAIVLGIGLFAANTSAADEIRVWVGGRLLQSEAAPRMDNDKVIAPVRELAEMLGATVKWNGERRAVEVIAPESESLLKQVRLLESAVAAKTPEEAVDTWARAIKARNGALQYAILSQRLKERQRESFEAAGWVTGTSSPWLERYNIGRAQENADGTRTFRVQFDYRTSEDADKPERWDEIASFPVIVEQKEGRWYVSALPTEWATQSAILPSGRSFSEYDGAYEGKHVKLQFQRLGVGAGGSPVKEAVGNHARIVETKELALPVGKTTWAVVERTRPAAERSNEVAHEYWLILLREDPERADMKRAYCLSGVVTGDKEAAKAELLDIAKTWKLLED